MVFRRGSWDGVRCGRGCGSRRASANIRQCQLHAWLTVYYPIWEFIRKIKGVRGKTAILEPEVIVLHVRLGRCEGVWGIGGVIYRVGKHAVADGDCDQGGDGVGGDVEWGEARVTDGGGAGPGEECTGREEEVDDARCECGQYLTLIA